MLNNIEAGRWSWLGANWAKISKDAQDLIQHMLDIDSSKRYTVDDCLGHIWFRHASGEDLGDITEALKHFQAKKKLKGAIFSVMAAGKMKNLMAAIGNANAQTDKPAPPVPTDIAAVTAGIKAGSPNSGGVKPTPRVESKKITKLALRVIAGKNLAPKDFNGKSDPYLRVFYGTIKYKTSTQKKR